MMRPFPFKGGEHLQLEQGEVCKVIISAVLDLILQVFLEQHDVLFK